MSSLEMCSDRKSRGLVLGVYSNEDDPTDVVMLTENAAKYNAVTAIFKLSNKLHTH